MLDPTIIDKLTPAQKAELARKLDPYSLLMDMEEAIHGVRHWGRLLGDMAESPLEADTEALAWVGGQLTDLGNELHAQFNATLDAFNAGSGKGDSDAGQA